jgi:hypothetical protein
MKDIFMFNYNYITESQSPEQTACQAFAQPAASIYIRDSMYDEDSDETGELSVGSEESGQSITAGPSKSLTATNNIAPSRYPATKQGIKHFTPLSQIHNVRNAYLLADEILQHPLNTFITINFNRHRQHWKVGNRSRDQVPYVRNKLFRAFRDWCHDQHIAFEGVYAIENPPMGGQGPHLHLLMHLPEDRYPELIEAMESFLCTTMRWSRSDIDDEKAKIENWGGHVNSSDPKEEAWLPFYISPNPKGKHEPLTPNETLIRLRYICKSVDPSEEIEIDGHVQTLEEHSGFGSHITLRAGGDPRTKRRLGATRSLSISMRASHGWQEDHDLSWLSRDVQMKRLKASVINLLERLTRQRVETPAAQAQDAA